jgi:hypothetical protein
MNEPLGTYLHDHLSGANFAIELLKFLREQPQRPVGKEIEDLLLDIEMDRKTLQGIIDRIGSGVPLMKEAAAWVAEKASELKLRQGPLGTFEALEALALGILGKLALWQTLARIATADARLLGIDFEQLSARAQEQHSRTEALRLQAATVAFQPPVDA